MDIDPKALPDAAVSASEVAPQVYEDVAHPAAQEIGNTLSGLVRVALAPLNALVWGYDRFQEWIEKEVAAKLAGVPPARIVQPPLLIAGPVVEAMRFAGHDEDLCDFFTELLATSMDSLTQPKAHPSFVDLIRQMTSDEAKLMRFFSGQLNAAVIDLCYTFKEPTGGSIVGIKHFTLIGYQADCRAPDEANVYLLKRRW